MLPVYDIHFIWLGTIPDWVMKNIEEFVRLNPDRKVNLHISSDRLLDVYRPIYETLEDPRQKSDLLRYSIIETCGGWYFDTDFWPKIGVKELEKDFNDDTFFLTEYPNIRLPIANGVIYSKPNHPYWEVIKEAVLKAENRNINSYGPELLRMLKLDFTLGKAEQFYADGDFVHK